MSYTTTVTSKYQVVIPKKVREAVKIKAGDIMVMLPLDDMIVVRPKKQKKGWADSLLGLGKELWEGVDALDYVRNERAAWEK